MEIIVAIVVFLIIRNVFRILRQMKNAPYPQNAPLPRDIPRPAGPREDWEDWADWDEEEASPRETPARTSIVLKRPEPAQAAREPRPDTVRPSVQKKARESSLIGPFSRDKLRAADVLGGVIWSQILERPGGVQRSRRRKMSNPYLFD
jgi:hypothetical protein